MSKPRPQWQVQAIAAQRRENELRRAEELKKVANYFERYTNKSRFHEQWTAEGFSERASKEAESLHAAKLKAEQLEHRRRKLEHMLFQENMQYQQEMRNLAAQPKLFKNGSYLNKVPTSVLHEVNQGIIAKEEQLRKQEADLKLYHAWRLKQPELRAANSYIGNRKLKSAWMEQIVEREILKKKEEEETRKILEERDKALQEQVKAEQEKIKEKDLQVKELRESLECQIAELSEKEVAVKALKKQEEKEQTLLAELQFITKERERELKRLIAERDATIINLGLHKYKMKKKVISVLKEIELDLEMLDKMRRVLLNEIESQKEKSESYKRILDSALRDLEEHREREQARQKHIDAMYDGEARQIHEKQDRLWQKEHEARRILMAEVLASLQKQVEEKIESARTKQKENVLEREKIVEQMDNFHQEVKAKERDIQTKNSSYATITALQSQLNRLRSQKQRIEAATEKENELREACAHERKLAREIAKLQREGNIQAWT